MTFIMAAHAKGTENDVIVVASDSQATTSTKTTTCQKMYCIGNNFIMAGAGLVGRLAQVALQVKNSSATTVEAMLRDVVGAAQDIRLTDPSKWWDRDWETYIVCGAGSDGVEARAVRVGYLGGLAGTKEPIYLRNALGGNVFSPQEWKPGRAESLILGGLGSIPAGKYIKRRRKGGIQYPSLNQPSDAALAAMELVRAASSDPRTDDKISYGFVDARNSSLLLDPEMWLYAEGAGEYCAAMTGFSGKGGESSTLIQEVFLSVCRQFRRDLEDYELTSRLLREHPGKPINHDLTEAKTELCGRIDGAISSLLSRDAARVSGYLSDSIAHSTDLVARFRAAANLRP